MRDPTRIALILDELGKFWTKYPDLRLGQILVIMNTGSRDKRELPLDNDVFNLEDDEFLDTLKEYQIPSKKTSKIK